jgi:hypothetical protein
MEQCRLVPVGIDCITLHTREVPGSIPGAPTPCFGSTISRSGGYALAVSTS